MQTNTLTVKSKSYYMILSGLFAALTAVCTMISIPLPFTPVPVNLATLSMFLAGGLLGAKYGALSQTIYTLIGAIGLPVFSNFTGGIGKLVGPTGGYIIGYIAGAFVVGIVTQRSMQYFAKKDTLNRTAKPQGKINAAVIQILLLAFSMLIGMIVCYALGTAWFVFSTNTNIASALVLCVYPFIVGDVLKITAATMLCAKLRKYIPHS